MFRYIGSTSTRTKNTGSVPHLMKACISNINVRLLYRFNLTHKHTVDGLLQQRRSISTTIFLLHGQLYHSGDTNHLQSNTKRYSTRTIRFDDSYIRFRSPPSSSSFQRSFSKISDSNNNLNDNENKNNNGSSSNGNDADTDTTDDSGTSTSTSDPPILTWVDNYLPVRFQPYARLSRMDKPIGTWLLLWPCFWSTALAQSALSSSSALATNPEAAAATCSSPTCVIASNFPDLQLLTLFGVGAFVMRGAGCTINDLWDQDIDAKVHRTQDRPLAASHIANQQKQKLQQQQLTQHQYRTQSLRKPDDIENGPNLKGINDNTENLITTSNAIGFLALQLSLGLGVLVSLPHTMYCFYWGCASLPLVVAYPLMKRVFPFPQLVLGLTFNWGCFMGWAAYYGAMDYGLVLPLYGSAVCWTLVYDTIYAHQDKQDDAKLNLHSTAITFGKDYEKQKLILHSLAGATYLQWLYLGYHVATLSNNPVYYAGVSAAYGHLIWQIQTSDFDDPHNLAYRFRSNSSVGALVFTSLAAGNVAGSLMM